MSVHMLQQTLQVFHPLRPMSCAWFENLFLVSDDHAAMISAVSPYSPVQLPPSLNEVAGSGDWRYRDGFGVLELSQQGRHGLVCGLPGLDPPHPV